MAVEAGPVAMTHFRSALGVELKADESPVTRADRAVEETLRARIAADFPNDGIFGEEFGRSDSASGADGPLWILDPIDGTRSFISGHGLFGMLIGRMTGGEMEVSVVALPAIGEIYAATRGAGATLDGAAIGCSACTDLAAATLYINEGERIWRTSPDVFARLMDIGANRRFSYDCYPYGLLAAGHVDAVVDCGLEPYDYFPVSLLVQEAGGVITDWEGRPLTMGSGVRVAAAATPELHAALLRRIAGPAQGS